MPPQSERDVLRLISYGLYILTTARGTEVNAITCNWLTQVSFRPPLIAVAIEKQSHSHRLLQESGAFGVNFLSRDQGQLARRMAIPHRVNANKLAGVPYRRGTTGVPILDEAMAFLECEVSQALDVGGDHTLFVAGIVAAAVTGTGEPLTLRESRLHYK